MAIRNGIYILDSNSNNEIYEILKTKSKIGGFEKAAPIDMTKYFSSDPNYLCLGFYEDNILKSIICFAFSIIKQKPGWAISLILTKDQTTQFTWSNASLNKLVAQAFEIAEYRNCRDYYYLISKRLLKIYEKKWAKNNILPLGRYNTQIEFEIPANTQPINNFYWNLMGKRLLNVDSLILHRELNSEILTVNNFEPCSIEKTISFKDWDKIYDTTNF